MKDEKKKVKEYVLIENKYDCCGCSVCANICPKDAISMDPDE